jgi:integrase
VAPGRKKREVEASLNGAPRLFRRGRWFAADLRAWGKGRPTLRDPGAPGWPNPRAGSRTEDPEVALRWALDYVSHYREAARRQQLRLGPAPKRLGAAADEYVRKLRDGGVPTSTWHNTRAALNQLRAFAAVDADSGRNGDALLTDRLTAPLLQRFFDALVAGGYAENTVHGYWRGVSKFLQHLGHGRNHALREVEIPPAIHEEVATWTDEQLGKLREAADRRDAKCEDFKHHRRATELGLFSGARRNELFARRWEEIDERTCTIRITNQLHKVERRLVPLKGRKARTALLLPGWWEHHRGGERGLILPAVDGGLVAPERLTRLRRLLLEEAGLYDPGRGYHIERHTYARDFIVMGGRFEELQKGLGHGSIRTTEELYGHFHEDVAASLARARIYKEAPLRIIS